MHHSSWSHSSLFRIRRFAALYITIMLTGSIWAQSASPIAAPSDLDAYIAKTMKAFDVPGLSLAVVKDGKILVAKGYGVRKLGDPTPVDAQTTRTCCSKPVEQN